MNVFLIYSFLIYFLSSVNCKLELKISEYKYDDPPRPLNSTVELIAGSEFGLLCTIEGRGVFSEPGLRWARRTKDLKFRNESDLIALAQQRTGPLYNITDYYYANYYSYDSDRLIHWFAPVKLTDRGAHFCMSLKYSLFKIVHVKVKEALYFDEGHCTDNQFRCTSTGICINLHYKCDGRADCKDGSDEDHVTCNGHPCKGKIPCRDGRCIPRSWCCDRHSDENCNVTIRPDCCPKLHNPFDPMLWDHIGHNVTTAEQPSTGSKYLFITICVVSALLSFVLFLFVISKICGLEAIPIQRTTIAPPPVCDHSECVLRRQFSADHTCLYRQDASVINNGHDLGDPLIIIGAAERVSIDRPPSYSEVINAPPSMDKSMLDLLNVPPPPYSSMKFEGTNQSQSCDTSGDTNNLST